MPFDYDWTFSRSSPLATAWSSRRCVIALPILPKLLTASIPLAKPGKPRALRENLTHLAPDSSGNRFQAEEKKLFEDWLNGVVLQHQNVTVQIPWGQMSFRAKRGI